MSLRQHEPWPAAARQPQRPALSLSRRLRLADIAGAGVAILCARRGVVPFEIDARVTTVFGLAVTAAI